VIGQNFNFFITTLRTYSRDLKRTKERRITGLNHDCVTSVACGMESTRLACERTHARIIPRINIGLGM